LEAIEHRVETGSAILTLLNEFRAATVACSCAEKATWSTLQGYRQQADLELMALLDQWRDEARQVVSEALGELPDDLSQHGLAAELQAKLAAPLSMFQEGIDGVTLPARVAGLPDQARRLVRELRQQIAGLSQPPAPAPDTSSRDDKILPPTGSHPALSDVSSVSRIPQ
jgi:hypothetical protein